MNAATPLRASIPVGHLSDLDPLGSAAVRCLRLWLDGPEGQACIWNDFAATLGVASARSALRSFETICDICTRHCRRPLLRRHVGCPCLGADESCFAVFVSYASQGDRDDALMIATTLVRADMAPVLVGLAQDFGIALLRLTRDPADHTPTGATVH